MTTDMLTARMVSVGEIIERQERFLVPLYQRLYVWKPEQVERLMDDIIAACQQDKPVYYLGGILAIRRRDGESGHEELELIDGQQRLTTLWLLAVAWWRDETGGESLADFVRVGDSPRLRFAIRDRVNDFIRTTLAGQPEGSAETAAMEDALARLRTYPRGHGESGGQTPCRRKLASFVRHKVKLALTEVPANTDLNKLFEVTNNRGEQLQHHDILKQRLLGRIPDNAEREAYARLWDACAAMDGYVERNLLKVQGQTVKGAFESWYRFSAPASLGEAEELVGRIQGEPLQNAGRTLSLQEILEQDNTAHDEAPSTSSDEDENEEEPVIQSILSFPLLLQHALRIFRHGKGKADLDHIQDKDLIAIFEKYFFSEWKDDDSETAKAFVRLLWDVRVALDAYVVKWVERDEGERQLDVRRIDAENGFTRTAEGVPRGLSLLQAVIYHSQGKTTQYWLTPFLNFALGNPKSDDALLYLKYLDHFLFTRASGQNLRELSQQMLTDKVPEPVSPQLPAELGEKNGTDFRHYWFYKTEYVIWEGLEEREEKASANSINVPRGWRIVARNSVEHIAPQQAIGGENKVGEWLDAFANLALVSREENSRYRNDIFEQKREKYGASQEATRSLKLGLVFQYPHWAPDTIEQHQQQLERFWKRYLERLSTKVAQRWMDHGEPGGGNVTGR